MIEYIDNKTIYHNYNDSDKGIYKITFNVNDEQQIYIGQTRTTFRKRIRKHLYDCRKGKHCGTFQSIWNLSNEIKIEALECLSDNEDFIKREDTWIRKYKLENLVNDINSISKRRKHV